MSPFCEKFAMHCRKKTDMGVHIVKNVASAEPSACDAIYGTCLIKHKQEEFP